MIYLSLALMVFWRVLAMAERIWKRRTQTKEISALTQAAALGRITGFEITWDKAGTPQRFTIIGPRTAPPPRPDPPRLFVES